MIEQSGLKSILVEEQTRSFIRILQGGFLPLVHDGLPVGLLGAEGDALGEHVDKAEAGVLDSLGDDLRHLVGVAGIGPGNPGRPDARANAAGLKGRTPGPWGVSLL